MFVKLQFTKYNKKDFMNGVEIVKIPNFIITKSLSFTKSILDQDAFI